MRFELQQRGEVAWHKRRVLTHIPPKPVSVEIPDYKQEVNHFCEMFVTYDTGETKRYLSRVLHNAIADRWTVDGMHESVEVIYD